MSSLTDSHAMLEFLTASEQEAKIDLTRGTCLMIQE